ncbi:MAG: N-6 DNA methylase [Flavobacteriaceae bacterium]|nr:N-6 DNA methylase [Flavobacteriaceae bacterium]
MIIGHLDHPTLSKKELVDYVGDGFHAWLLEHRSTKKLMIQLASEIQKYQWEFYSQDVLKYLYHALTPPEQRKEFGEFYTPDYLAKDVVEQVLDDDWLDESIERAYHLMMGKATNDEYLGVLDPSCGSGTFLLQSAIHIKNRIRRNHKDKLFHASKIIARLVHGIDIHPIAVEMSKATLRAILTDSLHDGAYRVCLGSALNEYNVGDKYLFIDIKTPKSTIQISSVLYHHPFFSNIVSSINHAIVTQNKMIRLDEFDEGIKGSVKTLYEDLKKIIEEEGNHIWEWLIRNKVYLTNLFSKGVGRIVGNPPWLVQNNAQESIRKVLYKQIAKDEGVYTRTNGYLANVDLACLFTARTIRLYLPQKGGGYGWVLPKSPIIGQAWRKWREGNWKNVKVQHQEMWDLTDVEPPIFAHSPNGCSVVLGKTTDEKVEFKTHQVFRFSGNYVENPMIKQINSMNHAQSPYLDKVERGVFFGPFCYFQVLKRMDKEKGLSEIFTQKGTRGDWKNCGFDGMIESECLLPLIDSKHLKQLNYEPEMWLIAPLDKNQKLMLGVDGIDVLKNENLERKRLYPHLHQYWKKCQKQYDEKRDMDRSKPILELNYGFKRDLEDELNKCGDDTTRTKVVYNSSGNTLRAIRIPRNIIANSKLYYILCESEQEAQYLVGVINAPNMQPAWRWTKTSKMHYHKSPFKSIPIPLFDSSNHWHIQIAHEVNRLEKLDRVPDFSKLNSLLKQLLPDYAKFKR